MIEVEIIKSGNVESVGSWALLRNINDKYALAHSTTVIESKRITIDKNGPFFKQLQWLPFESTSHLKVQTSSSSRFGYHINSVLDFGMYQGYKLGVVYALDASYIEWCILKIKSFFICDFEELEKFGVIQVSSKYERVRETQDGSMRNWINYFSSTQDIIDKVGYAYVQYRISEQARTLNKQKYHL